MSASWSAIQDAIYQWAVAASGYASDKVIWRDQDGFAPLGDYLILSILGSDTVEGPVRHERTDPAKPPGQEVILTVGGTRSVLIEAQVLTSQTITATDALATAERMRTRTALPSVRDLLLSAGISPFDAGSVQQVNQVRAANFVGRAVYAYRAYLADLVEERGTYIQKVQATGSGIVVDVVTPP
jgi:hypothetical protein